MTQSGNLYTYGLGNPNYYVDQAGEEGVAVILLYNAFTGDGTTKDYSSDPLFLTTFSSSPTLRKEVEKRLKEFKKTGEYQKTITGSIGFYGNDINSIDRDLHLGVGKANYVISFVRIKKDVYDVTVTISDTYDFDEYRDSVSLSNMLNNWGYDRQKKGDITPFYWRLTFKMKGLEGQ